jgi:hypothetical protein
VTPEPSNAVCQGDCGNWRAAVFDDDARDGSGEMCLVGIKVFVGGLNCHAVYILQGRFYFCGDSLQVVARNKTCGFRRYIACR